MQNTETPYDERAKRYLRRLHTTLNDAYLSLDETMGTLEDIGALPDNEKEISKVVDGLLTEGLKLGQFIHSLKQKK